jgi:thiol-disulfide isomerase/thioredoxin
MRRFLFPFALLLLLSVQVFAQSGVRLEGQVVCCEECWAEADRTKVEYGTAENLLKAKSCVEGGDPTLLAVREGDRFTLYQLEQGKFRLPGKNWLDFVGKRVAVTGAVQTKKDRKIVRVDALTVLAPSLAEREAAKVLGSEAELKLRDLSGAEQSLSSFKGRIVILNFWATYCLPCKEEMPDLAAIQNEYAVFGVQVIGASTDEAAERAKVLQFIKETRINFPIWMGATTADMLRFGLGTALPGSVLIGKDGRIAKVISGVVNQADLKKQIDAMLSSTTLTAGPATARGSSPTVREGSSSESSSASTATKRPAEVSSVPS